MELFILTFIAKWLTFATFIIAFVIWNSSDILNGFLKYMFLIGALCAMVGSGYPQYLIITNFIIFGILGITWRSYDNNNQLVKAYLIILAFLHLYILTQ